MANSRLSWVSLGLVPASVTVTGQEGNPEALRAWCAINVLSPGLCVQALRLGEYVSHQPAAKMIHHQEQS